MQKINADVVALFDAIKELKDRDTIKYTEELLKQMEQNHDTLEKLHEGLLQAIGRCDGAWFDALWNSHLCLVNPDADDYIGKDIDACRNRCNEHDSLASGAKIKSLVKYKNPLDKGCKMPTKAS